MHIHRPKFIQIVNEIERIRTQKEELAARAFDLFEKTHVTLATMVKQNTRDRRAASLWMIQPLRSLDGKTPYHALADGDETTLWQELGVESELP